MANRTWIAVAMCCAIWFVYMRWFAPIPEHPKPGTATTATSTAPAGSDASGTAATTTAPPETVAPLTGAGLFAKIPTDQVTTTIDSGKLQIGISDAGAKVSRVAVEGFHVTIAKDSPLITPVEPQGNPFSLATLFTDPALQSFAHEPYAKTTKDKALLYTRSHQGIEVSKEYLVGEDSYRIATKLTVTFPPGDKNDWGYLVIPVGATAPNYDANDPMRYWEIVTEQNDSVTRKTVDSLDDQEVIHQGTTRWLAYNNRYFATVLINESEINPDVVFTKTPTFTGGYLRYPLKLKAGQKALTFQLRQYIGPKDYKELSKTPGLRRLIDFGMFAWLAYPLLELLRWFYQFFHNWGVAIILLTLLVRTAFYPLQAKATRSMKAMSKLQPQIAALKERYKEDPARFNQEQLALFKAHKVNPMGGCLPMLVQLPVFFALYAMLGNSLEFFHAPFFGWIKDLSVADPFYVLPILMGISMFVQQKMTPAAGMDPMQQKILYLMPVVFTFVMLSLPSGLTLYIFVSTVIGILQQMVMNREKGEPAPKLVAVK